ncbi:MAG: DNA polymerase III subunit delta [Gaiellaceae bacterium]
MADAPDKAVYLLTGSDRPKIETALARLRGHFDAEAVELVSAIDVSGEGAVALCNSGGLFGDARLVVVEDVDGRRGGDSRRKGGWKAADVETVVDYLESPAPATVLALVAEDVKKTTALWKACAKAGTVLEYAVEKKKLAAWIADQFRQRGARAEPEACTALVQLVGDDLHALSVEVDKLSTWAGGESIGEREVLALAAPMHEEPLYVLTDAVGTRDGALALAVSETIFERDDRPRRDVSARMAGAIAGHVTRLATLKRMAEAGVGSKEAATELSMHPFRAQKLFEQADGFSTAELEDAVVRVAALDGALKGQSRLAPDLEVQRTLADITRRPGAAGRRR